MAYDLLIGFKLNYYVDVNKEGNIYLGQVVWLLYFAVLYFSFILAPFGILYLVIKGLQFHSGFVEKMNQAHRDKEALKKEIAALREEINKQNNNEEE